VPSSTSRTGAAGAYWTAGVLTLLGWDASITIGNTPRTDIVAQHHEHQTLVAVQCKAKTGPGYFVLTEGCESPSMPGRNEWFVLVALRGVNARPDFFVVPRNVVAAYIFIGHRGWMSVPAKSGDPHKDNTMRNAEEQAMKYYRERWDLLEQAPEGVPYWLPDWVFEWAERTGLPAGHPGLIRPDDGVMSAEDAAWLPYWAPAPAAGTQSTVEA
jgi:hypothetical protein